MEAEFVVIYVTCSSEAEAKALATKLLQARLVACANTVPGVKSYFWWEGKIDTANECLLMLKTLQDKVQQVQDLVLQEHSYSLPEIIALPVMAGSSQYFTWIKDSIAGTATEHASAS